MRVEPLHQRNHKKHGGDRRKETKDRKFISTNADIYRESS
jgi:hypothetical protein